MRLWRALTASAVALALAALAAPLAGADTVISGFGEGAGKTFNPFQIALSPIDGSLDVADQRNNRVDVFDSAGHFEKAIGWGVATGAPAFQTCTASCRAGIAGSGSGQFSHPTGMAVDNDPTSPSFGSFYVYDSENLRVEKFSPAGTFLLTFGGGVNKTDGSDVCAAASGDLCGAGSRGVEPGEFGLEGRPLATGPGGLVYVGDSAVVAAGEVIASRVQKFDSTGAPVGQFPVGSGPNAGRVGAIAVDSEGDTYLSLGQQESGVTEYSADGALLRKLPDVLTTDALAVDASDHLFAEQRHSSPLPGISRVYSILELDPTGAPLRDFGYGFPEGGSQGFAAAVGQSFDLYASERWIGEEAGSRILGVSFPPPGPVVVPLPCVSVFVGNAKATVECAINPEGSPTTVHFQFVDQAGFEVGGFEGPGVQETTETGSIGGDFKPHAVPLTLEGLRPETTFHYRVVATNADGGPVFGPDSTFTTRPPVELGAAWSSEVGTSSAQLHAEANPLVLPTTGFFEYVDDDAFRASGFANAARAPQAGVPPIDFGEGEEFIARSVELDGLAEGTTYHYRLVVSDRFVTVAGPPRTFVTASSAPPQIADDRGFELVSPAQKESAEAGNPGASGGLKDAGFTTIQQGSPDGDAFSFTSFTSFGESQSAPGASQYLARRGADGWTTRNVTPAGHGGNPLQPPVRGLSPPLALGAVVVTEPPLTPDADPDHPNLYLQTNDDGALKLLSTGTPVVSPNEGDGYCIGFGGMTASGSKALLLANGALTPNAPRSAGFSLYEWTEAAGLRLASVLPGEVPATPATHLGFGAEGAGGCGLGSTIERHALSADGSKVFWTFVPRSGATRLLARIGGRETIQLDAKQGGTGNAGNGKFWAASADGSKVIFTDTSKLVPGASAGNLYRYDFGLTAGSRLVDLTPGPGAANVEGVLGASEDGSAVYFVAAGILSSDPNGRGEVPVAGKDNLYAWRDGAGIDFVATLSVSDEEDWTSKPREQTARVSPDGSAVAFVSRARLTGYDNEIEGGGGCVLNDEGELGGEENACAEVFVYDAGSKELVCAACNPRGQRPVGPAALPAWASPYEQPRYLSADGSRLFFQTLDPLDLHDVNGEVDVYELERAGDGSCTTASPTFREASGACVFLISSGTDSDPAFLLDASEDGSDVFFSTRARLVGQDEDGRYDVYDARVGGGFAPPEPPADDCSGEACRPEGERPPGASPPGTSSQTGEGNLGETRKPPVHCGKGKRKVTRKGKTRCVKVRRHHRRAGDAGRGGSR